MMERLSRRERAIFSARLRGKRKKTLAELGEEFGVSGPRIRQIEQKLIHRLKVAARPIRVKGYGSR